jgi:isoquinoline 1-oxidoreductase alpha subunit
VVTGATHSAQMVARDQHRRVRSGHRTRHHQLACDAFAVLGSVSDFSKLMTYTLTVNGEAKSVDVDADTPLLWVLRDSLDLVGTKFGCGGGFCGACTIHLDGRPRRACQLRVSEVGRARITTIEGLSVDNSHPVQRAWHEIDVPQCGYCQAGQIMTAAALLARTPNPTDDEIVSALSGNLCRCGTYTRIRRAVRRASALSAESAAQRGAR